MDCTAAEPAWMLRTQSPSTPTPGLITGTMEFDSSSPSQHARKRKANSQETERERLSKRLSLLNIEHNGPKLYVPVEEPSPNLPMPVASERDNPFLQSPDDSMQLDDSKHKVYIYDLDDELSSDSDNEEGRLVFLPDIEKHLKLNRIPPRILANNEGELAGMQMVLYSDPKSLTVPEEQDSVRKAIIEARHRARERQKDERQGKTIEASYNRQPAVAVYQLPDKVEDEDGCITMDVD